MIERDFCCKGKASFSDIYCQENISHEFLIIKKRNEKSIYDRKKNNLLK